ncbi:MAG: MmgE/PrpD family protein [Gammaproteobacteria bacterium]|nr:MmgE/PrpD family protein [Gammaproteobacteria bacterium]MCP4982245.1 MmgE/PrpD family protein [Gammaproteobacteria bacterium]
MTAIRQLAQLISHNHPKHHGDALTIAGDALIDTIACIFAGAASPVAINSMQAVKDWGGGNSVVIGRSEKLAPPFAAMINGAAGHALDYDDFDEPGNAHPSVVIFPALLAMAASRRLRGSDLLDAYIIGLEVLQRLGEAMNMDHYRRGWLSTLTLGTIAATAACARLGRFGYESSAAALSLAASMASGLTNQSGYLAKQLHPGLAAKNGVMASALAAAGINASDQTIDGSISLATAMGDYQPERFNAAMAKLGKSWSILEHGLLVKCYPCCGYTHRAIEAAIDIHGRLKTGSKAIQAIQVSVPDYYLDLLVYSTPGTPEEAMFSLEYNVAVALASGSFCLASLNDEAIADSEHTRLTQAVTVVARVPRDANIVYDPLDPDIVEVTLEDGSKLRAEAALLTGSPARPMSGEAFRAKFDECLEPHAGRVARDQLWDMLRHIEQLDDLNPLLASLSKAESG